MKTIMFFIMSSVLFYSPGIKLDITPLSFVSFDIQNKSIPSQEKSFSEELQRRLLEAKLLNQSV